MSHIETRRAKLEECGAIARLHRAVREQCLPYLPHLHTPADDLRYFSEHVFREGEVWVATENETPIGYCAFRPGWLDHLYVLPGHHGRGAGTALLERAQEASVELQLWTFQKNDQARRFYERAGFVLMELTDGLDNEEREPDARYCWRK